MTLKKLENVKETDECIHNRKFHMTIQSAGIFLSVKLNMMYKNNWKWLVEENVSKNYTKTIRLFALDFYELIYS